MNLSMRDKKILLMFLGVLLFALSFLFVYKPQMEEAAQISANNDSLQERLSQLLDLAQNREAISKPRIRSTRSRAPIPPWEMMAIQP